MKWIGEADSSALLKLGKTNINLFATYTLMGRPVRVPLWRLVPVVDPVLALLVFAAGVLVVALMVWPDRGLLPRLGRLAAMTERVRVEDALKHLHHVAETGHPCTLESLAGALEISRSRAVRLVSRLAELDLARPDGQGIPLTDAGRDYALRILRTHRLWERYLADRTGVAPGEWHEIAERKEHRMSAQETEVLASRMGHPLYDPHGDPIPTALGQMPPMAGTSLSTMRPGQRGTIVHLEDEPRETYDRLLGEGLALDMPLEVLQGDQQAIRFRVAGQEHALSILDAANVTVARGEAGEVERWGRTLVDLAPGECARVVGISTACQGPQRRRLLDLGVVPGTEITYEMRSASGDPVAYRIRGAMIALRRQQAAWIQVGAEESAVAMAGNS